MKFVRKWNNHILLKGIYQMELIPENIKYNPKNSFSAIFYFIFGSFLIWWSWDKIAVFNSVFDNNFPKILVWVAFITMFIAWIVIVPFLCLTGKNISVKQFLSTFYYGFMGLLAIIIGLPIAQTIITALETIFSNVIITGISWLVVMIAIIYLSIVKPYEVLY